MYHLSRVWELGKVLSGRPGQGPSRWPALQVDHLPRGVLGLSRTRFHTCDLTSTATSIDSWVATWSTEMKGVDQSWTGVIITQEANAWVSILTIPCNGIKGPTRGYNTGWYWYLVATSIEHNIIQSHNNVLLDWQYLRNSFIIHIVSPAEHCYDFEWCYEDNLYMSKLLNWPMSISRRFNLTMKILAWYILERKFVKCSYPVGIRKCHEEGCST